MSLIILNVDEVRRTLSVSDASAFVVNDKNVDVVRFALMAGFTDIALDERSALRVMYQRPGETEVRAKTLTYYDTDGIRNYYDWELLAADLAEKGVLNCALCILRTDSEVEEWHTTPCQILVLDTIHTDDSDEGDESITPTVAQRVAVLESVIQGMAGGAPVVGGGGGGSVTVDDALSATSTNPVQNKVLTARINGLDSDVGTLRTSVQSKADTATVSALADAVNGLDSDVQGLQTTVQAKADTATVTALSGTVSGLQTAVQSKADTATVTALSDYVDTQLATKASTATATTSSDGLMSAQDKSRLDAVYADYTSALTALGGGS